MSTVHFIIYYSRYVIAGMYLTKWLVPSVETDKYMFVLLVTVIGDIPEDTPSIVLLLHGTLNPRCSTCKSVACTNYCQPCRLVGGNFELVSSER